MESASFSQQVSNDSFSEQVLSILGNSGAILLEAIADS